MTEIEHKQLSEPHVFSGEVHFALLNEGLRGPRMRELLGLARRDSELGRIFEMKVAEFRRYLRESRVPTWWNLPQRAWEWLSDNAQFTPPREVFMTLVYVVLVLVGIEAGKRWLLDHSAEGAAANVEAFAEFSGGSQLVEAKQNTERDVGSLVETWMLAELKLAAESPAGRQALAQQLAATMDRAGLEDLLRRKIESVLASPEFQAELEQKMREAMVALPVAPTTQDSIPPLSPEDSPASDKAGGGR